MGLMDSLKKTASAVAGEVKEAASAVGTEAGKAGRIAQAQIKLKSLQGDVADAEKALGQAAFVLAESGELQVPALDDAVAKVREAKAAVAAKEAEIEAIKAESDADRPAEAGPQAASGEAAPQATAGPTGEAPAGGGDATRMPGT